MFQITKFLIDTIHNGLNLSRYTFTNQGHTYIPISRMTYSYVHAHVFRSQNLLQFSTTQMFKSSSGHEKTKGSLVDNFTCKKPILPTFRLDALVARKRAVIISCLQEQLKIDILGVNWIKLLRGHQKMNSNSFQLLFPCSGEDGDVQWKSTLTRSLY